MHDVACDGREAARREHGGEREQHGDAGGDERAKGYEHDQEGDRHRQLLRPREPFAAEFAERMRRARVAELRNDEPRAPALDGGHRVQHRLHAIVGGFRLAAHGELNEHRVTVHRDLPAAAGRERRAHVLHLRRRCDCAQYARDHVLKRRFARGEARALHEHGLIRGLIEVGARERRLRARRAPAALFGFRELHDTDSLAERCRGEHEGQPTECGLLPVCRAPPRGSGCDIHRTLLSLE